MPSTAEDEPSPIQDLTFHGIDRYLLQTPTQVRTSRLELRCPDGRYNTFALMVSDQCTFHIAIFSRHYGPIRTTSGCILNQYEDAMATIKCMNPRISLNNRCGTFRRFPSVAVREALLNAMIHSTFAHDVFAVVTVDTTLLTVESDGGFSSSSSWKDVAMTDPRNWRLAMLLLSLGMASLKGRGSERMRDCYRGSGVIPCMVRGRDVFTVRLPSIENDHRGYERMYMEVARHLRRFHGSTLESISVHLLISNHFARKIVASMMEDGVAFSMGTGSGKRIYLTCSTGPIRPDGNAKRKSDARP